MNGFLNMLLAGEQAGLFGDMRTQMIVIMVGFVAFFYFFVVRPQNKKKKEMQKMFESLKKGTKVVSIGGIHGKIVAVKEKQVVVRIDSNAEITFEKNAISRVLEGTKATEEKAETKKEESKEEEKK